MKTVSVLLTKYSDRISSVLYHLTGRTYTHASLGVDGEYYSFNYKGFCTENVMLHRKRGVRKSMLYELNISDASYQRICEQIQYFQEHRNCFRYSSLGVICCLLHIPFRRSCHYFCSQFVAEVLTKSGAVPLKTRAEFCLPVHFLRELSGSRQLVKAQIDPI